MSWMLYSLLMSLLHLWSNSFLPVMVHRIFISVFLSSLLVAAVSALVLIAYDIIGLTQLDTIAVFLVCTLTSSMRFFPLVMSTPRLSSSSDIRTTSSAYAISFISLFPILYPLPIVFTSLIISSMITLNSIGLRLSPCLIPSATCTRFIRSSIALI
ncbi:hypothetical protein M0802_013187 [Mischocyttarus mexicanus]|nr:hypothetical protein M0802_013187 [Mischocyttarus mexicanus]